MTGGLELWLREIILDSLDSREPGRVPERGEAGSGMAVKSDFWNTSLVSDTQELPLGQGEAETQRSLKRRKSEPSAVMVSKAEDAKGLGQDQLRLQSHCQPWLLGVTF